MFDVGSFPARTCRGISRRSFLRLAASVPLALGLPGPARPAPTARARSVIFTFLWGGPSHLDTFDPKPEAPAEYRGPYRAIGTNVLGIQVTELLPRLARRA